MRRRLSLAAKLHDIGKVGVPEAILNKIDDLTEDEFAQLRETVEFKELMATEPRVL